MPNFVVLICSFCTSLCDERWLEVCCRTSAHRRSTAGWPPACWNGSTRKWRSWKVETSRTTWTACRGRCPSSNPTEQWKSRQSENRWFNLLISFLLAKTRRNKDRPSCAGMFLAETEHLKCNHVFWQKLKFWFTFPQGLPFVSRSGILRTHVSCFIYKVQGKRQHRGALLQYPDEPESPGASLFRAAWREDGQRHRACLELPGEGGARQRTRAQGGNDQVRAYTE